MNRSSGGAGARPMYSTYTWWPTRVHFAMEISRVVRSDDPTAEETHRWDEVLIGLDSYAWR